MKDKIYILLLSWVTILVLMLLFSAYIYADNQDTTNRCVLYEDQEPFFASSDINGIYNTDSYYCVWTEGRSAEEIANTEQHEIAHVLVNKEKEHFCGGEGELHIDR